MNDEQLIEAVRNHSALYDLSQAAYRNVDSKEKAWTEISVLLSQPGKRYSRLKIIILTYI